MTRKLSLPCLITTWAGSCIPVTHPWELLNSKSGIWIRMESVGHQYKSVRFEILPRTCKISAFLFNISRHGKRDKLWLLNKTHLMTTWINQETVLWRIWCWFVSPFINSIREVMNQEASMLGQCAQGLRRICQDCQILSTFLGIAS